MDEKAELRLLRLRNRIADYQLALMPLTLEEAELRRKFREAILCLREEEWLMEQYHENELKLQLAEIKKVKQMIRTRMLGGQE